MEACIFNRNFDNMRQTNREYFKHYQQQTALTERQSLDSGTNRRFLTGFHSQPSFNQLTQYFHNNPQGQAPTNCLPIYNQLNQISKYLAQHQSKIRNLPTQDPTGLLDSVSDLQSRKDELIRSRHSVLDAQAKIYKFHVDQVDRKARNHMSFTQRHQSTWNDLSEKKDTLEKDIIAAEQELLDLLGQNVEEIN